MQGGNKVKGKHLVIDANSIKRSVGGYTSLCTNKDVISLFCVVRARAAPRQAQNRDPLPQPACLPSYLNLPVCARACARVCVCVYSDSS